MQRCHSVTDRVTIKHIQQERGEKRDETVLHQISFFFVCFLIYVFVVAAGSTFTFPEAVYWHEGPSVVTSADWWSGSKLYSPFKAKRSKAAGR